MTAATSTTTKTVRKMRHPVTATTVAILLVLGLLPSCSESAPERPAIVTNATDILVCCDADAELPIKVGQFQVQIYPGQIVDLDPESVSAALTTYIASASTQTGQQHTPTNPVRLSVESGGALEVGSTTIEVFVDDCNFTRVDIRYLAELLGRRKEDQTLVAIGVSRSFAVVNTCPPTTAGPTPPQLLVEAILGAPVGDFASFGIDAPVGVPVHNATSAVPAQVPDLGFTEAFQVGALVVELDQDRLDAAFLGADPLFPVGVGELGLTMRAEYPLPMQPGRYLIAWQCVVEDTPVDGGEKYFQFGFVADRDRDSGNNYRALAPFDTDPYDDTDSWFVMQTDQFLGWRLVVSDAAQSPPYPPDSAALGIVDRQVHMFLIPVTELGDPSDILGRFTTFVHEGDFGLTGGPWSGDVTPPIDEPRIPIALR